MNKDNMQKVIDAIKFDGAKKFNMTVFVGKLEYEDDEVSVFENDELAHTFPVHRVRVIHEGTDLFNCTSMGCIAGFATALAYDWKTPDWMRKDDPSGHLYQFENESCFNRYIVEKYQNNLKHDKLIGDQFVEPNFSNCIFLSNK